MKKAYGIYYFLLVFILFSIAGCRPKGVLSSKQMENIFVDLHTTESILQQAGYNYGHDEAERAYYLVVLDKYGITQAEFDSSLIWYTAHPTIFDKIYPKVVERLQAQADAYTAWMNTHEESRQVSLEEWLQICQRGYNWDLWTQKDEKNTQKFVYVKKKL